MDKHPVLLVDDEEVVLEITADAIGRDNYNIFFAKSGEEGLSVLESQEVHMVISDQKMTGMSGLEFLKEVQQKYKYIITIMLTGYAEVDTAVEAINEAGVYKFIVKPWNAFDLRTTVFRALESRHLMMEKEKLLEQIMEYETLLRRLEKEHPDIIGPETSAIGLKPA